MLTKILISAAASAIFAVLMGVFFRWLHRRYVTPLDFPNKELAHEIEQTRVIYINCPPDKALLAARSALEEIQKIKAVTLVGRKLVAKTGITFRTFGEHISIIASPSEADSAQLTIESRPRFSGTAVDYGKSYENVERIAAHLSRSYSTRLLSANNSFKPTPLRGVV